MSSRSRALSTGARLGVGVLAVAVVAAVTTAALVLPLPGVTVTPTSVSIDPAAAEQVRACPGPLVRLSDDTGADATAISSVGTVAVTSGASDSATALEVAGLDSLDDTVTSDASSPVRIGLPADSAAAGTLFAAAQSQSIASGDLVGFAATACAEATADSWLVAGATTVGRTSFVVLANPGDVPAVVDVTVFGEQGAVDAPGGRNVDVGARSTRILSLAGLAPDLKDPVVHVVAKVGAVAPAIQQSIVRGLQPGGVEQTGATAAPATTQTVAGVQISGSAAIAARLAEGDNADLQSVLRLFVPGTEPASVTIRVSEEKTGGAQTEYQVGLNPGVSTEFALQDVPDGTYTIQAQSDQPIVMGARTSTLVGEASDFSWYQALTPLPDTFFVSAPTGPGARLHLVNDTGSDVTLTLTPVGGEPADTVFVPGGRSVVLDGATSYTASTTGTVSAVVTYSGGDGAAAAFAIEPPSPAAAPIVVYP